MNNLDRRVSVAPMMDWSDSCNPRWLLNDLRFAEVACSSFVAAAGRSLRSALQLFVRRAIYVFANWNAATWAAAIHCRNTLRHGAPACSSLWRATPP